MGNAVVMGLIPQVRYILLSDLLLSTMSDDQIEAVFAHEVGHVMHKHMFWLVAAMSALMLCFVGPGQFVIDHLDKLQTRMGIPQSVELILVMGIGAGLFWLIFGYMSRNCERQADVFAARTLQNAHEHSATSQFDAMIQITTATELPKELPGPLNYQAPSSVGEHGAAVFCSALEQVALVNNIRIEERSWCHGSIASRMKFLEDLGKEPKKTVDFDRSMKRIFVMVMFALCVFGAWAMVELARQ
jgi:STE24 endopeptidase